ncbi:MAG TPA: hypothetical protein VM818_14065 [Vicinamibacterales bacterium]|nr:hypothetical protein [Vicinamibacterales bacterium]
MVRMQRSVSDFLMSAAALVTLIVILAAFDGRVREQLMLRMDSPSAQVTGAGVMIRDVAAIVFDAARDQTIEHAPLVIFVAAATVLLLFMLRT